MSEQRISGCDCCSGGCDPCTEYLGQSLYLTYDSITSGCCTDLSGTFELTYNGNPEFPAWHQNCIDAGDPCWVSPDVFCYEGQMYWRTTAPHVPINQCLPVTLEDVEIFTFQAGDCLDETYPQIPCIGTITITSTPPAPMAMASTKARPLQKRKPCGCKKR